MDRLALQRLARMSSGLVLFAYIALHLTNHALGLISLGAADAGMSLAIDVWGSLPGTILLYGAFAVHFLMALIAIYERRTLQLPPLELLRIVMGFTMPVMIIGHAAATRLAYELFGVSSDYTRVVATIWANQGQVWQLGIMAPGWLHGCLGLHFAFRHRWWFRRTRMFLFTAALLLPVLAGLGFLAMGKELSRDPEATKIAEAYLSPDNAATRLGIEQWKNRLLNIYFGLIMAAFVAREIRNIVERRGRKLITLNYPGRTVQVPRGWTVLEASRSFHVPHASMCGGRARCSTCRVRVTAGLEFCPTPGDDERAMLDHIQAPDDVRLACQLKPEGDVSVTPLVRTALAVYRGPSMPRHRERAVVMLSCDVRNSDELAGSHLRHDLLYLLVLTIEGVGNAIRANGGTLNTIESDRVVALFEGPTETASRNAVQAAGAIEAVIADLNRRYGQDRDGDHRVRVSVCIAAGEAAIAEIAFSEPPKLIAVGEVVDRLSALRHIAAERQRGYGVETGVYAAAGLEPPVGDTATLDGGATAVLSDRAPVASPTWTLHGEVGRTLMLRRLLTGR